MIIVAVAWLYVVILMAVMQPTLASAAGTLVGYGLIPLAIVLWIMGIPQRLRSQRAREAKERTDRTE